MLAGTRFSVSRVNAASKQESVNEEFVNLFITEQHFTKQSIVAETFDWTETHKVFIKVTAKS